MKESASNGYVWRRRPTDLPLDLQNTAGAGEARNLDSAHESAHRARHSGMPARWREDAKRWCASGAFIQRVRRACRSGFINPLEFIRIAVNHALDGGYSAVFGGAIRLDDAALAALVMSVAGLIQGRLLADGSFVYLRNRNNLGLARDQVTNRAILIVSRTSNRRPRIQAICVPPPEPCCWGDS